METGSFSESIALLQRNESAERNQDDVVVDLQRLLLLSRDHQQREHMIRAEGVRRVILIGKAASQASAVALDTRHYCAAILANLAQSERGRLSGSSCNRWKCVSHRHNCPLFSLLQDAQQACDRELQQLSAAAVLAFSIQNECQRQIDAISGIPILLRLLDSRNGDVIVYAAATLWNMTKSPLLMLKLETIHGLLKDALSRRLSGLLWAALAPFQLAMRPTGERACPAILDSDGNNASLMVSASVSVHLRVVLQVENYVGPPRVLLAEPFGSSSSSSSTKEQKSSSHFDESGVLTSRSCAVCRKAIPIPPPTKSSHRLPPPPFVVCAREGCDQTYHVQCSRWHDIDISLRESARFFCNACVLQVPDVQYCDFVADHEAHASLLTEARFKSVPITRIAAASSRSASPSLCSTSDAANLSVLFSKQQAMLAVCEKKYRIPRNRHDMEMFVVHVRYLLHAGSPSMQQARPSIQQQQQQEAPSTTASAVESWHVSYATAQATQRPVAIGSALLWPGEHLEDVDEKAYMRCALSQLEAAFLYEFTGESQHDRMYSFGPDPATPTTTAGRSTNDSDSSPRGLWTTLHPRRGICMKLLAEQIGHCRRYAKLVSNERSPADLPMTGIANANGTSCGLQPRSPPHKTRHKRNKIATIS